MIVAGFGFRRGTSVDSMLNALRIAGGDVMPDAIATAAAKVDEVGFQTLASRLNRPVIAVDAAALVGIQILELCTSRLTASSGSSHTQGQPGGVREI